MAKPDVVKLPSAKVLGSLISQQATAKSEMDDIKGDIGEKIANAVEKHNLHASAFKQVAKLRRMDAVKLMAWLTHFDDYREKLELDKLAAPTIPGMDDGDGETKRPPPMFEEDGVTPKKQPGDGSDVKMADGPGTGATGT